MSPASDAGRHRGHGISTARSPWTDSRFGLLQLAVLAVALVRLAVTVAFGLDIGDAVLEVSTVALFVVPVVIASLNFGVTGGLATVAWVAALDIPRMVDAADHAQVPALWSEVVQLVVLLALALLIGTRVTAETRFRSRRTPPGRPASRRRPSTRTCSSPTAHRSSWSTATVTSSVRTRQPSGCSPRTGIRRRPFPAEPAGGTGVGSSTWSARMRRPSCSPACSTTGAAATGGPRVRPMGRSAPVRCAWRVGESTTDRAR